MSNPRILLAEDDFTMVALLKTLLGMEGYQVIVLANEDNVVHAVRKHKPDVLLMDVHLFGQNGLEILSEVRNSSDVADAKIIMSSGANVKEECLNGGGNGFLMKPYMPDDLFKLLKKVIAS